MKQFNPDFEYKFWFWKTKFNTVMHLLALLLDYDFMEGELEGTLLELKETNANTLDKWTGGLHYGKKDVAYIKLAKDGENPDIIHVFIATHEILKERIVFIDQIQASRISLTSLYL
jgi:hypothetical protein